MTELELSSGPQLAEPMSGTSVSWSTFDGLVVLVGAFVIYIVGAIVLGGVDYAINGKHTAFWVGPASYLFLSIGTLLMVSLWLIGRRGASWGSIGFRAYNWGRIFGAYAGSLIAVFVGESVIVAIVDNLHTGFHIKGNAKELLPTGQSHIDVAQYVTLVLLAAVLAPVTEEILFRGVLFQAIRRDLTGLFGSVAGIGLAALFSGLLFGGFHLLGGSSELYTLPILVYLGIVLALAFQGGDSIAASGLVHASVNFISVTLLFAQHH